MAFIRRNRPTTNSTRWKTGKEFIPNDYYKMPSSPETCQFANLLNTLLSDGELDVLEAIAIVNQVIKTEKELENATAP